MRIRYYIEYQYSESFQFFTLFKRSGAHMHIERCVELSALQYQDFYRPPAAKDNTSSKLIGFPKLVVYELIEYASGYPKYYVRAYERRSLDTKIQAKNVYMWVKGRYVGSGLDDSHTKEEYTEEISQIDVFYGSNVEYVLSQFIKRILDAQKEVYPKLEVNSEK